MQLHQIESWTLQIIDQVINGQPNEDTRVELKSEWPDPIKAARRIAGHANAARGSSILWLIGVDEKAGIVKGAKLLDLANWHPQVESQFDGLAPHMVDLNVPYKGNTVVALLFETIRRPFVVKNPLGGSVSLEVPWRIGTSVRSAKREDLIRLLSPLQALPTFEVLTAILECRERNQDEDRWMLKIELYVEVDAQQLITIPFHRCEVLLVLEDKTIIPLPSFWLSPPSAISGFPRSPQEQKLSKTIEVTQDEVLLFGPGKLILRAVAFLPALSINPEKKVFVEASLVPVHAQTAIPISVTLTPDEPEQNQQYKWTLQK